MLVDGELAEAVAEVMARYIPDGVVIETTAIAPDDEGEGYPTGPLRVCGYLPNNDNLQRTKRQLEEALWYLSRISPLPQAQYKPIQQQNWMESWKEHYHPIPIGEKLLIVPAWIELPSEDRAIVKIDPGMAFGTGTHPTTQLCLALAEKWMPQVVSPGNPIAIIDIGCGSGILSIAAIKLGATHALGVDIDPEAIAAAQVNAQTNDVLNSIELGIGSIEEIQAGAFCIQSAPFVFANILAPVIIRLLNQGLGALVALNGILILSGILEEQASSVLTAAQEHGFTLLEKTQIKDWVALAVNRFL